MTLGAGAGSSVTTADNVICIEANLTGFNVNDSCFIGNVRGAVVSPDAVPVVIDSSNKLGTTTSSKRFKKDISPIDDASESILLLKPVTFHYKSDKTATPQFGLVAEEVDEVNPNLVVRDENGEIYTVRYDAVNAMLLNEFLKEHRKNEAQEATITTLKLTVVQQQKAMEILTSQIREQTAQIQKVSAEMGLGRSALQLAAVNP